MKFFKKNTDTPQSAPDKKRRLRVNDKFFFDQLPFVIFLTFIGVLYIANSYYVEGTVREMETIKKDIIEAKNEFVIAKTESSLMGQRIEVLKIVEVLGLKEFAIPSYKLEKADSGE
ncbi:MAG: hypothetical protein ACJAZ2_000537 [Glaciecola sp.]|jgi:hypothetical protein